MTFYKTIFLILFVFLLNVPQTIGQLANDRKSEEEVKLEDQFIAAKLLVSSGKKSDAIKMLDSLRRVSAPSAAIYFELAKLQYENKDINQTESNLKSAIQLEPNSDGPHLRPIGFLMPRKYSMWAWSG